MNKKNTFKHKIYFIIFAILLPLFIFLFLNQLYAIEINGIKLIGNTVPIDLKNLVEKNQGNLTRKDIESISVYITREYHRKGYTTSFVSDIVVSKKGIVQVYIKESSIRKIIIKGITYDKEKEIRLRLMPNDSEIFNRFVFEKRLQSIKRDENLKYINVKILNYKNTEDITLIITINAAYGQLYGSIGYEQIYGISPRIGYLIPFNNSALNLNSSIGYRDGMFRKIEGEIRYYISSSSKNDTGYYIGTNTSKYIDTWESKGRDFTSIALAPCSGFRYRHHILLLDFYFIEKITRLNNYQSNEFLDYDSRLVFEIDINNSDTLLESQKNSRLKYSLSGGRSTLEKNGYLISTLSLHTSISLFSWFNVIPGFNNYYTNSNERFLMKYVFDNKLLGFSSDFTASNFINTAGLDFEFEISPSFIYIAPFLNSSYFVNEFDNWELRSGCGIKLKFLYHNLFVNLNYAWDIKTSPAEGVFYIFAESTF